MLQRRKASRPASILRRTILIARATTAMSGKGKTMEAAATAAAGGAGGAAAGADAIVGAVNKVARVDEICRRRNMPHPKVANIAGTTIAIVAANSTADTIIDAKKGPAARAPRRQTFQKRRFFFPANRWQSTATKVQPLHLLL